MDIGLKATKRTVKKYLGDYIIWANSKRHVFTEAQRKSLKEIIKFWNNPDTSIGGLTSLVPHHNRINENKGCEVLWVRYIKEYTGFLISMRVEHATESDVLLASVMGH